MKNVTMLVLVGVLGALSGGCAPGLDPRHMARVWVSDDVMPAQRTRGVVRASIELDLRNGSDAELIEIEDVSQTESNSIFCSTTTRVHGKWLERMQGNDTVFIMYDLSATTTVAGCFDLSMNHPAQNVPGIPSFREWDIERRGANIVLTLGGESRTFHPRLEPTY